MKTIKGPGVFLAQFLGDSSPFNSLSSISAYMAGLGYKGVQLPTWDARVIDLKLAASSLTYCDQLKGELKDNGVQITELSTHLQGQLLATHPAYDSVFNGFAPAELANQPQLQQAWAAEQLVLAAKASKNLGLTSHVTFSGALLWPFLYPWPQRPKGLVETGFSELARRWKPILDVFDQNGVDVGFELHPGEDLHDGVSFEYFLDKVSNHPRAKINYDPSHFLIQRLDYLQFIDFYHERICAFHVKDAEFNPSGKQGVYGGYQGWVQRAGRFRSLGDGQVDFGGIFSKLSQYGFEGWAVLEWECALKDSGQGAAEGAPLIEKNIIQVTQRAFDDFASAGSDEQLNKNLLGIIN
jgi:sugar phosphate isomerase/epimerase